MRDFNAEFGGELFGAKLNSDYMSRHEWRRFTSIYGKCLFQLPGEGGGMMNSVTEQHDVGASK